jgi:hypothetical protein
VSGWCARFQLLPRYGHCFGVCTGLCSVGTGFCDKRFFRMKIPAVSPYIMAVEMNRSAKLASERIEDTLKLTINAVKESIDISIETGNDLRQGSTTLRDLYEKDVLLLLRRPVAYISPALDLLH